MANSAGMDRMMDPFSSGLATCVAPAVLVLREG